MPGPYTRLRRMQHRKQDASADEISAKSDSPEQLTRRLFVQKIAFAASLFVWFVAILGGCVGNLQDPEIIPRKVKHRLIGFDKIVRKYGPAIPLVLAALRLLIALLEREGDPRRANNGVATYQSPWRHHAHVVCLYFLIAIGRLVVYLSCLVLLPHVMADHIFLGASMHAVLSGEIAYLVYDIMLSSKNCRADRDCLIIRFSLLVLSTSIASLLAADMFYTARYFHTVSEVGIGLVGGLILFQLPVVGFISYSEDVVAIVDVHAWNSLTSAVRTSLESS
ncbi:hypothetical protein CYMTET_6012 [Cymbomonas tetramitiformis]|uniref:Uncharacterized protein n=1 Tax=Cymbomonas tetramitiformis TaxID=36881 RepID=A0AAE0GYD7_9CHLO|nr:hypothetical protein CYMTET_6012 [Cymbomonas tetramitiformis]